jgi:hypothetical protein
MPVSWSPWARWSGAASAVTYLLVFAALADASVTRPPSSQSCGSSPIAWNGDARGGGGSRAKSTGALQPTAACTALLVPVIPRVPSRSGWPGVTASMVAR